MNESMHLSVLIVDDDISDLNALYNILKSSYSVYFAKSGQEAVKRAADNRPDIILLDVVMPDMSGYEVISELKKSDITNDIPVIFITGLNNTNDELKGFKLGAVDYITKPFHSAIVKVRIESHLKTARQLGEKDSATIPLKTKQTIRNIRLRELVYVDIVGHWLNFHLNGGEIAKVYASIKDYEDILLSQPQFERCHKSFIVNMDFISMIEINTISMKSGENVPISKGYADFKKRYAEWINR